MLQRVSDVGRVSWEQFRLYSVDDLLHVFYVACHFGRLKYFHNSIVESANFKSDRQIIGI